MPAYWKLLLMARQGWKKIPPEQRRRALKSAGTAARKHGPTVAKRVGAVVKNTRKAP